jgi:tetratricopeptide (TPR) repeat protein
MWQRGDMEGALATLERALDVLSEDQADADAAMLTAQLARFQFFAGNAERAAVLVEQALEVAEAQRFPEVISQALNTKALVLQRRPEEALGLLRQALAVALEHDLAAAAGRAYFNISYVAGGLDRLDDARAALESSLALARRRGQRYEEQITLGQLAEIMAVTGDWDGALALLADPEQGDRAEGYLAEASASTIALILLNRGEREGVLAATAVADRLDESDVQARGQAASFRAIAAVARGDARTALDEAERSLEAIRAAGGVPAQELLALAGDAALELGDLERLDALLGSLAALPPVGRTHSIRAHEARLIARRATAHGVGDEVDAHFTTARALFREVGMPFWLAATSTEHAEWLQAQGRGDEARPLLDEAEEVFERLAARPWLERVARARESFGERVLA